MDNNTLNRFRLSLIRHKDKLLDWVISNGKGKERPLANTDLAEQLHIGKEGFVISEIDEALEQIEEGTFGQCKLCSGEVEPERMVLDFTTCICLDHYSERQKRDLERDLEMAAKVQRHLLPCCLPALDGLQLAVMAKPAGAVGGDYYDFFRHKDHWQGLAIADVMGKGVPASLLMANLQASLRILGSEHDRLDSLAKRLNELFRYNLKLIRFITLFLAAVDIKSKKLHYCNAGHHPPLLWRASSGTFQWLKPTGPAIGLVSEARFTSGSLQLDSGDVIVFYTDGLVEARNEGKEEFGEEGLAEYVSEHHEKSAEVILDKLITVVQSFAGSFKDDLTVMILKME